MPVTSFCRLLTRPERHPRLAFPGSWTLSNPRIPTAIKPAFDGRGSCHMSARLPSAAPSRRVPRLGPEVARPFLAGGLGTIVATGRTTAKPAARTAAPGAGLGTNTATGRAMVGFGVWNRRSAATAEESVLGLTSWAWSRAPKRSRSRRSASRGGVWHDIGRRGSQAHLGARGRPRPSWSASDPTWTSGSLSGCEPHLVSCEACRSRSAGVGTTVATRRVMDGLGGRNRRSGPAPAKSVLSLRSWARPQRPETSRTRS